MDELIYVYNLMIDQLRHERLRQVEKSSFLEKLHVLFTPFFSTTKNGQGIGLMLTREILYNHDFKFSLQSSDVWTEFKIMM